MPLYVEKVKSLNIPIVLMVYRAPQHLIIHRQHSTYACVSVGTTVTFEFTVAAFAVLCHDASIVHVIYSFAGVACGEADIGHRENVMRGVILITVRTKGIEGIEFAAKVAIAHNDAAGV